MRTWPALEVHRADPQTGDLIQAFLLDFGIAAIDDNLPDLSRVFFHDAGDRDRAADALREHFPASAFARSTCPMKTGPRARRPAFTPSRSATSSSRRRGTIRDQGSGFGIAGPRRARRPDRHRHPAVDGVRHRASRDHAPLPRRAAADRSSRSSRRRCRNRIRRARDCGEPAWRRRRSWRSMTMRMPSRRRAKTWR